MPDRPTKLVKPVEIVSTASFADDSQQTHRTATDLVVPLKGSVALDEPVDIPGYEFVGVLGQGGMGVVYSARDTRLNRDVAVKVLHKRYTNNSLGVRRFVEESQITGQLQHPGVPPVHELGTLADERPFLAMKLIKGQTLAQLLRRRASPAYELSQFLQIFEQICQTLAYAHNKFVIHRDLKPGNVMVGAFGEVQVMDWGLAKVLTAPSTPAEVEPGRGVQPMSSVEILLEADTKTQAGDVLGTPAYMPPEQARGDVDLVDRRADVFTLGGVLCVILTGQPPFVGEDLFAIHAQAVAGDLSAAYRRLDESGADPELCDLAKRCLSGNPADRPADGEAVADAMAAYRLGVETRLRQAELERAAVEVRVVEQRKRRHVQLALAASVLAFLFVAGGGIAWYRLDESQRAIDRQQELAQQEREKAEREIAQAREQERLRQVVGTAAERSREMMDKGLWVQAERTLTEATAVVGAEGPPELHATLAAAKRDLALATRLDEIRTSWYTLAFEERTIPLGEYVHPKYVAAFRDHGYDIFSSDPTLIPRLKASPIARHLLAALDEWMIVGQDPVAKGFLWTITQAVGDEPWRYRVVKDWASTASLKGLFDATPAEQQSPAFVKCIGLELSRRGDDGRPYLKKGTVLHPADFALYIALGAVNFQRKAYAEAAVAFQSALAIQPESLPTWFEYCYCLALSGEPDQAAAAARRTIRLKPDNWRCHQYLGFALEVKKDWAGARAAYQAACALADLSAWPFQQLAGIEYADHNYRAAAAAYRAAIARDPTNLKATTRYGWCCIANGEFEEAEKTWRTVVAQDRTPVNYYNLGIVRRSCGDRDGAAEAFRQARGGKSLDEFDYDNVYVGHLSAVKMLDYVLSIYESAVRAAPEDPFVHLALGTIYSWLNRYEESIPILKRAETLRQGYANWTYASAFRLATNAVQIGDFDTALAASRAAIQINSTHAQGHADHGTALFAKGDFARACRELQTAVDLKVNNPRIVFLLALALRQQGDRRGALHYAGIAAANRNLQNKDLDDTFVQFIQQKAHWMQMTRLLFESAAKHAPSDPYVQLTLAYLCIDQKRVAEGMERLKIVEKYAQAQSEWPYSSAAKLCNQAIAVTDFDTVLAAGREAVRRFPNDHDIRLKYGWALWAKGHHSLAEQHFRAVVSAQPKDALARYNLALALWRNGLRRDALDAARKAMPDTAITEQTLEVTYLKFLNTKSSDYTLALKVYESAATAAPQDPFVLRMLYRFYVQKKRFAEAAEYLGRSVTMLSPTPDLSPNSLAMIRTLVTEAIILEQGPAILALKQPAISLDQLMLVVLRATRQSQQFAAAARAMEVNLRSEPRWRQEIFNTTSPPLFRTAVYATQAWIGSGDGQSLTPQDRIEFRQLALKSLREHYQLLLAESKAQPQTDAARARVHLYASYYFSDPWLKPARHPIVIGLLPPAERDAWKALWADVRALQAETAPAKTQP